MTSKKGHLIAIASPFKLQRKLSLFPEKRTK